MAMELILKKHIPGLGAEADIVKVKPGYARNFLIPRDYATVATGATKKLVEDLKRKRAEREAEELNRANDLAGKLGKVTLTFQMKSSTDEKVFGSVTAKDIIERLKDMDIQLERKRIKLGQPLKEKGEHKVDIDLGSGVHSSIKVVVDVTSEDKEEQDSKDKKKKK
ncbi:MAG: 50S ribosomal protein L9 [Verrucomicrobiota bacterium]